jgi:hypothetical protein
MTRYSIDSSDAMPRRRREDEALGAVVLLQALGGLAWYVFMAVCPFLF